MSENEPKLIPLRVRLPYATEEEFVEKYGSNVARGGIFVATQAIKPEGTPIAFEFVLAEGQRLLRGDGVVVKVHEGVSRSGMTLRFVRLDAKSKALIDRVLLFRSGIIAIPPDDPGQRPANVPPRPAQPPGLIPRAVPPVAPARVIELTPHQARAEPESSGAPASRDPLLATTSPTSPEKLAAEKLAAEKLAAEKLAAEKLAAEKLAAEKLAAEKLAAEKLAAEKLAAEKLSAEKATDEAPAPAPPSESEEAPPPVPEKPILRRRPSLPELAAIAPPPKPEVPQRVIGIDLGTTNARVAVFQDGRPELIPLTPDGAVAVPSCVAIGPDGGFLVGEAGRTRMITDPRTAVFAAKRFLGQRARSPRIRAEMARVPYALVPDAQGDAGAQLGDRVFTLPEVSAALLGALKQAAERHLGHPVSQAVLCVPAYFNDHQRSAMREAGRLAGLDVLRIFNEPSSVALAFGYGKALPRKRILVYDFGGGTFDASVVEVTGDDLEVVAIGGDNFLGGMDFDARISDALARRFEEREHSPLDGSAAGALRLREVSEHAKIALSAADRTSVHLAGVSMREGRPVDLDLELTRADIESLTADLVERTIQVTHEVLGSAGLSPQSLDEILLVGGQTRAPLVRRRVQQALGKPVRTEVDPHAAVSLGAAILGHAVLEASRGKPGVTLSEVLSAPIGVATRGGGFLRVLERNTRLPAEKTIQLPARTGTSVGIAVFQGAAERAEENEYLGSLTTEVERDGEISVRFSVGADGTLTLSASPPGGRSSEVQLCTADASDETRAALYEAAPLPGERDPAEGSLRRGLRRLFGKRS